MQKRLLSGVARTGAALATAALLVAACDSNDSNAPVEKRNINNKIQLNSTAAANGTTALLNGETFTGLSGSVLASHTVPANTALQNQAVTIAFSNISGANGNFTLTTPTLNASGTVHFASCTFTVTASSNTTALPVGAVITVTNCSVTYTASGVPVGQSTGTAGKATLNFDDTPSNPLDVTVEIQANGILVVTNGLGVQVVTTVVITGSTGS
ncbi:MAG TPA: hypothetical protein VE967_11495 [Gemmatimonadaceae bacterium]|nr:hypothetical protein [Gemmatimonadaceae bacterium]